MSRLYGRAFDVFQISKYLEGKKFPKYHEDNKRISFDELVESSAILDFYLPDSAIDYILQYPIKISKSPILPRSSSSFPTVENPNASIYFRSAFYKEEQKRELVFFLGSILSIMHPDKLPKDDNLSCEYGDIFSLLLDYLYLKKTGKEENFFPKHLKAIRSNASKYIKAYEKHQMQIVNKKNYELDYLTPKQQEEIDNYNNINENIFVENTLRMLVPYSSIDGVLQIVDKYKTDEDFKKIINDLYENPNNNRQEILNDMGIESYGYKTLRKEIDKWSIKNEQNIRKS